MQCFHIFTLYKLQLHTDMQMTNILHELLQMLKCSQMGAEEARGHRLSIFSQPLLFIGGAVARSR